MSLPGVQEFLKSTELCVLWNLSRLKVLGTLTCLKMCPFTLKYCSVDNLQSICTHLKKFQNTNLGLKAWTISSYKTTDLCWDGHAFLNRRADLIKRKHIQSQNTIFFFLNLPWYFPPICVIALQNNYQMPELNQS